MLPQKLGLFPSHGMNVPLGLRAHLSPSAAGSARYFWPTRCAPPCDILNDEGNRMKVEDEYLDALQNIEFGIISVFRADRALLDLDAKDAIGALVRRYRAEQEKRTRPMCVWAPKRSEFSTVCCPFASGAWGAKALRRRQSWDPRQPFRTRSMTSARA